MEVRRPKSETRKKSEIRSPSPANNGRATSVSFRIRDSDFFRPSGFDLRVSGPIIYVVTSILALAAGTNDGPELPSSSLRPPRGEILPTFWEQYGLWVMLGAVFAVGVFATLVWLLARPRPPVPIPPAVRAREELEPLMQKPEEGILLSQISQTLRRYLAAVFPLPPGELTTTDLSQLIVQNEKIGPELGGEVIEFLRACDLRKFAPGPPPAPLEAVSRAFGLIDRAEKRLAELNHATQRSADSESNGRPPSGQRIVSGA